MSEFMVGTIGVVVMIIFLLLGMPIGFTLGIIGFLGVTAILGFSTAVVQLPLTFYSIVNDYNFTVLPFFILMGYFAGDSGISADLYMTAEKWLRRLPGGLALATIAGCAGFASISGSSVATAATMGTVALPEMKKRKYADSLATGSVAAGGTLGFLIPPSVAFVIYGIITEQSVGKLLIAGFVPGLILALTFMGIVIARVKMNPSLAPISPEPVSWKDRLLSLRKIWGVILIFLLVMGGIYGGFFTPTEAGAMGAFFLLIFALGRRKLTIRSLFRSLMGTAQISCMIFLIIFGAFVFNDFMALSQVPILLMKTIGSLEVSKYVIFSMIIALFIILGCFIESIPMIILVVPVTLPIILSLGFSPIWFGVISVLMVEAALITPPVGMNVYVIGGVARGVPVMTIFRGALPFLISIVIVVIILAAFPQIALFLPSIMIK